MDHRAKPALVGTAGVTPDVPETHQEVAGTFLKLGVLDARTEVGKFWDTSFNEAIAAGAAGSRGFDGRREDVARTGQVISGQAPRYHAGNIVPVALWPAVPCCHAD